MILIFILTFLVLSSVGRPQNDGMIHTDLIPERRLADPELTAEMVESFTNVTDRQNDGTIHTDLIPERREDKADSRAHVISCECAAASSSDRIVGGSIVSPRYKYPYQVLFQANGDMCGGTIINKRYVLTAQHCILDKNNNEHPVSKCSVVVGEHDIRDGVNEGGQVISIRKFINRYDYDPETKVNDIAILELWEEIRFTENVKPACLPTDTSNFYGGKWGIVSGWGGTVGYAPAEKDDIQQKTSDKLKATSVKIRNIVWKTFIYAFAKDTDSCQGDSGGPLVVVENGKYVVVGVVSHGPGCAYGSGVYGSGVYTRVTNYLSWIKRNTEPGDCAWYSRHGCATLYEHCNFRGIAWMMKDGDFYPDLSILHPDLAAGVNDKISSFSVKKGCTLYYGWHAYFQEGHRSAQSYDKCLVNNGMNDKISSLQCECYET